MRALRAAGPLRSLACAALLALTALAADVVQVHAAPVRAVTRTRGAVAASGSNSAAPHRTKGSPVRAPSGPPLLEPGMFGLGVSPSQESSASAPPSAGDVLADNGLDSPLCRSLSGLPEAVVRNCRASGFIAAPAPTGDYAFDVNIDTGSGKLGNDSSAIVQDFAQQGWMALVALTHALVVMFEWCFSLNLLGGAAMSDATRTLHATEGAFSQPWMGLALSIASVLAAYHGLLRRRVADTVGQALVLGAMTVAGLWVIADPAGTVGVLERWADEGASGTLAAMVTGVTDRPRATLAASMTDLFGTVVSAPWCYLEFGNVSWCEDPRWLDPRLRRAALSIAGRMTPHGACRSGCAQGSPSSLRTGATGLLLRQARTNGELFLALPANELERNSSKAPGTLLNVLCGGAGAADKCRGPTASEAEFRSERGTDGRLIGLASIWLGALGMLLLFGLLAMRLLIAAAATLLYLLLAPAAVLVPALGEWGRSLFGAWMTRLLAACVSKLTYSFLLGALLGVTHILLSLTSIGWWAQWCLISAFWWTAFLKRRGAVRLLSGERHRRFDGATPLLGWRTVEGLQIAHTLRRSFSRPLVRPLSAAARRFSEGPHPRTRGEL